MAGGVTCKHSPSAIAFLLSQETTDCESSAGLDAHHGLDQCRCSAVFHSRACRVGRAAVLVAVEAPTSTPTHRCTYTAPDLPNRTHIKLPVHQQSVLQSIKGFGGGGGGLGLAAKAQTKTPDPALQPASARKWRTLTCSHSALG
jgi:hypothetical protein